MDDLTKQLAEERQWSEKFRKERDERTAELATERQRRESAEKANADCVASHQRQNLRLSETEGELEAAEQRADRAEAAFAEMRDLIERMLRAAGDPMKWPFAIYSQLVDEATAMLSSTSLDHGYIHRDQIKPLVEALEIGLDLIHNSSKRYFANGVKDQSGSMDEGEVIARSIERQMDNALKLARTLGLLDGKETTK